MREDGDGGVHNGDRDPRKPMGHRRGAPTGSSPLLLAEHGPATAERRPQ